MKTPSIESTAKGIHLCINNGERYLVSAELLLKENRLQDAFLLGLFSLEEMGKVILVWNVPFHQESEIQWEKWLKRFKDHSEKFWFSRDLDDIMRGNLLNHKENKKNKKLAKIKQKISYVDLVENSFISPYNPNTGEVKELLKISRIRLEYLKLNHPSLEFDILRLKEAIDELKGKSLEELNKMTRILK